MPDAITFTQARKNLDSVMEQVCDGHAPCIITRHNAAPVVLLSLEDYNSLMETAHLQPDQEITLDHS